MLNFINVINICYITKVRVMHPTHHVIISFLVFGFLYLLGLPFNFVMVAFLASILVDIDHMALGRIFGTYNPIEIYNRCMAREIEDIFTSRGALLRKWFDLRVLPFHNLFLNVILIMFLPPVGIGVLLHNILDGVNYMTFNVLGWNGGGYRGP